MIEIRDDFAHGRVHLMVTGDDAVASELAAIEAEMQSLAARRLELLGKQHDIAQAAAAVPFTIAAGGRCPDGCYRFIFHDPLDPSMAAYTQAHAEAFEAVVREHRAGKPA